MQNCASQLLHQRLQLWCVQGLALLLLDEPHQVQKRDTGGVHVNIRWSKW